MAELDYQLAEFINALYHEGGWPLSGFKRFLPRLKFKLPTAQHTTTIGLRDQHPFRAVPIPWIVAKAMVGLAWRAGHHDVAVLILVGFCYFLRTMEFVTLPVANVVVDLATSQIVVSLDRAKTSEQYQQSLLLRHRTLARILSHALPRLSGRQRLWAASARDFRKCFTCLVEHLGLQDGFFAL